MNLSIMFLALSYMSLYILLAIHFVVSLRLLVTDDFIPLLLESTVFLESLNVREISFLIEPHLSDIKVTRGPHAFLVSLPIPRFAPIRESRALLKFCSMAFPAFSELTLTSFLMVSMEPATTPFMLPQALSVSLSDPFHTSLILSPILPKISLAPFFKSFQVSPKDFDILSHDLPAPVLMPSHVSPITCFTLSNAMPAPSLI